VEGAGGCKGANLPLRVKRSGELLKRGDLTLVNQSLGIIDALVTLVTLVTLVKQKLGIIVA
jgi:hypothetical protein